MRTPWWKQNKEMKKVVQLYCRRKGCKNKTLSGMYCLECKHEKRSNSKTYWEKTEKSIGNWSGVVFEL